MQYVDNFSRSYVTVKNKCREVEMSSKIHTEAVKPIEKLLEQVKVDTVFGTPIKEGDVTIVPVAEVHVGFGYGWGFGKCVGHEIPEESVSGDGSGGAGAGAGIKAIPRGYIWITPKGVKFKPIRNKHYITFAGIALVGLLIFLIVKLIFSNKEDKDHESSKRILYNKR
jgi:uncharacterized spore protein YtfJ